MDFIKSCLYIHENDLVEWKRYIIQGRNERFLETTRMTIDKHLNFYCYKRVDRIGVLNVSRLVERR